MTQLYKWSTDEQINQLKQYLAHRGPTTASFLGYLLRTRAWESGSPGKSVIWTSHQEPLNTTDVVVWLIDSDHRTRFFVSSEVELNSKEMTPEAISFDYNTLDPNKLPPYFKDSQDEQLYRQSLQTAEEFLVRYMDQRYGADTGEFYHDTCLLWAPIFHKLFKISLDVPCFVFSRQASKPLDPIKLPLNYSIDSLDPTDVHTVITKNKLAYDPKYVLDCSRISSAIRAKGELVAWGMTHRDLFVGALHVLPEYRRQGLAKILVIDLCRQHAEFFKSELSNVPLEKLYAASCVEIGNDSSARVFKKAGFEAHGLGSAWIHCYKK